MSSLRIALVGKTGAGKSTTGNIILGTNRFKAAFSIRAVTAQCQKAENVVFARKLTVVDTPGLFDVGVSEEDAKTTISECFSMCAPGPHVFLLVVKLDRFSKEEKQVVEIFQELFGKAAIEHAMILFTGGDQLEDPSELETLIEDCVELNDLLNKLGRRYHVFNNKINDCNQVRQLLAKIDQMIGESGAYYTCDMFQVAKDEQKKMAREKKKKEELRQEWHEKPELRILLLGEIGVGKTTARNIILGKTVKPYSQTLHCQKTNGEVLERRVSVIDTPGLFGQQLTPKKVMHEILSCVCLTSPGPHVFLIVAKPEQPSEVKKIEKLIKKAFGKKALNYVKVLFIEGRHGPALSDMSPYFDQDLESAELFTNAERDELQNESTHTFNLDNIRDSEQVTELLQKIDRMVERNGGSFFHNELYPDAERAIVEEQIKILEKLKQEISKGKSLKFSCGEDYENTEEWRQEIRNARKEAEINNLLMKVLVAGATSIGGGGVGATTGAIVGSVVGVAVGGPVAAGFGAGIGAAVGASVGAVGGGVGGAFLHCKLKKIEQNCIMQ